MLTYVTPNRHGNRVMAPGGVCEAVSWFDHHLSPMIQINFFSFFFLSVLIEVLITLDSAIYCSQQPLVSLA